MKQTVTMKAVADAAGVTTATVSKILNGRDERISDQTRKKVKRLMRDLHYVPNNMARGLKTSKTRMIGFILPDITNPFYPAVARGLEQEAETAGYGVILCNTDNKEEKEQRALQFLYSRMVDGIVFVHSQIPKLKKGLEDAPVPLVAVDREVTVSGDHVGIVGTNVIRAVKEATSLLIAKGCRNIAFISAGSREASRRYLGFAKALEEAGLTANDAPAYFGSYDYETGENGMRQILATHPDVDGLVAGDDLIAIGAWKVMSEMPEKKKKKAIPFAVIGFGDYLFTSFFSQALTTVHLPAFEMGQEAARMLIGHIEENKELSRVELPYSIILREIT